MRFIISASACAVVGGEEERALEDVAGVEHQHVAAGGLDLVAERVSTAVVEPRGAAEALARGLVLGGAGGVRRR